MNQFPTDITFYERLLAALEKHKFAAVLLWVLALVGIIAWAYVARR